MLKFTRPKESDRFEGAVANWRANVKAAIELGDAPKFESKWGDFKPEFSEAQNGKCGYCELPVTGGQFGDVEHYAPKSEVGVLNAMGQERTNSSRVKGRKIKGREPKGGYWWLAYDWKNYLLSCAICNQQWKSTLFPVKAGDEDRQLPPDVVTTGIGDEKPLLLNPFEKKHPRTHLKFGVLGEVVRRNGSEYGAATIEVCGLDRPSLRSYRAPVVRYVMDVLREWASLPDDATVREEYFLLRDLANRGQKDSTSFPGVVRCVVWEETGLSWNKLKEYVETLAGSL